MIIYTPISAFTDCVKVRVSSFALDVY